MFATLSDVARAELVKMLAAPPAAATAAAFVASAPDPASADDTPKKRGRKPKKVVDPNAPPKEKRAPNDWILFSTHVEKVIREKEAADGVDKDAKMRTVVAKQFASSLKSIKPYSEWADADILVALSTWTPPEVSKQAVAKAAAEAEAAAAPAPADAAEAAAAAKKRGPKKLADMTPEERAAHDEKVAERKAKKAVAADAPAAAAT
jgi:hypothetical protein